MRVKNALKSEECKALCDIIGQTCGIQRRISRIAEDVDALHKANGLISEALNIICQRFGETLCKTLAKAREIEDEEKAEVTFLGRGKDAADYDELQNGNADSDNTPDNQ